MTIKHLVIPGGGPSGIQAIGALQQLEKSGFWNINDIKTIYATSAGAITALLLALKFDWETINDYIILRPWQETYNVNISQILEAYSKKGIFDHSIFAIFYKPFFEAKDLALTMTMKEFYEYSGIEMHFFSLELNSFEVVDISHKTFPDISILTAVHMSSAIPMIISPICIEEKCFVDGGVVLNYPLKYCVENEKNVDEIFGIQNVYKEYETNIVNNRSTILDYIIHFTSQLIKKASKDQTYDNIIPYELKYHVNLMGLNNMKETLQSPEYRKGLLEKGRNAADEFLSSLGTEKWSPSTGTKDSENAEEVATKEIDESRDCKS